jgi:hypothetical protein
MSLRGAKLVSNQDIGAHSSTNQYLRPGETNPVTKLRLLSEEISTSTALSSSYICSSALIGLTG